MLKSFQARLIMFVLVLLALVQLGTALAVLSSLKEDNYRQGVHSIDVSRNVFDLFLEARAEQLTKGVEILTSDFGFKQAVATRETGTIRSVLQNHGARINADISLLVSPKGELITATQELNISNTIAELVLAARRSGGSSISTMIGFENRAYQLVLVPIKAPNVVAWVGMAFLLDQALAEQIKNVTGLDISFVYDVGDAHTLSDGSTLPQEEKEALLKDIGNVESILKSPVFSNDEKYLSLGVDLGMPNQWGIIHLPYGPWLQSYNNTRNQLVLIFTGALALALLFGIALARNMTKPISRLIDYAKKIGLGGAKDKVSAPDVGGEFGVLSHTMKTMQDSIINREEELTHRASHDQLTGLFNQSAVEQYLSDTLPKEQGGLVLINIRHFKDINNMLGFDVGNLLLSKVAERLQTWGHDANMLARLSGDKFLFIFGREITHQDCSHLKCIFSEEFEVEKGSGIRLDISIAVLPFEHATATVNSALRRLDIVADEARESSALCVFYKVGQDENHRRQLTIIRDLPKALEGGQLFVVYQPKVGLAGDDCHEAEALIRWVHPELGFLPPDEFISLLEHAGSIQQLTKWVLNTVLSQLSSWWAQGQEIRVAVNLSAHDLLDEKLPFIVSEALQANGLPTRALALEVTESAVMKDRAKVISILQALQEMGIHLAIDDFGTGQSSLSYLRELPVNEVKIDRAFIQFIDTNKGDEFITKATIELSHSLGFQVTAEGAENAEGTALLRQYHCDKIQGYFFSKPLVAEEFFKWRETFHSH
ncbi:GGDEF domain-containing protein [Marinomonas rhizomae]|uniref:Diguanylate cyclase/phosphodiesterase n=1 Tax=Marinomonas rhizomae TaxID=491948 RepID=A0A366IZQ1_9GAMM|nr:EAL domain-containing protein [Marinomonas rhizomae]RBP79474.1 diguanylate cyclase/phosphodiesterase [Marinomonas rhizomae]RNF71396.1 GGDEF domain-containing protein [Marinomonas rhizomae]